MTAVPLDNSITQSACLGFTVLSHGPAIIDNHLFGDPLVTPDPATGATDGTAAVIEQVFSLDGNVIGGKIIFDEVVHGQRFTQFIDWAHFPPQSGVNVLKRVFVNSSGGIPSVTFFDQTFSQVSEPGMVGMAVGMGIVGGLCGLRLRRR